MTEIGDAMHGPAFQPAMGTWAPKDLSDAQIKRELIQLNERIADLVAVQRDRAEHDEEIDQARGI